MTTIQNIVTHCPKCGTLHLDVGEWRDRPHKTHLCLSCGELWKPIEGHTRGVEPVELAQAVLVKTPRIGPIKLDEICPVCCPFIGETTNVVVHLFEDGYTCEYQDDAPGYRLRYFHQLSDYARDAADREREPALAREVLRLRELEAIALQDIFPSVPGGGDMLHDGKYYGTLVGKVRKLVRIYRTAVDDLEATRDKLRVTEELFEAMGDANVLAVENANLEQQVFLLRGELNEAHATAASGWADRLATAEQVRDLARAESNKHLEENRALRHELREMSMFRDTWMSAALEAQSTIDKQKDVVEALVSKLKSEFDRCAEEARRQLAVAREEHEYVVVNLNRRIAKLTHQLNQTEAEAKRHFGTIMKRDREIEILTKERDAARADLLSYVTVPVVLAEIEDYAQKVNQEWRRKLLTWVGIIDQPGGVEMRKERIAGVATQLAAVRTMEPDHDIRCHGWAKRLLGENS